MKSMILPISKPPVTGYLHQAIPLSIIANSKYFDNWFYSNYIQLCCNKQFTTSGNLELNFFASNFMIHQHFMLDIKRFPLELLNHTGNDWLEFAIECLDKGYYLFTNQHEPDISNRQHNGLTDLNRESLLFGYDKSNCIFHNAGYNNEQVYSFSKMTFEDFALSHSSLHRMGQGSGELVLIRFCDSDSYKFDCNFVIESIEDYLKSFNSSNRHRMYNNPLDLAFGIDVYNYLSIHLNMQQEVDNLCMGNVQIMWEHKKCMIQRLKLLEQKLSIQFDSTIMSQYEEIAYALLVIRNVLLKYSINRKREFIDKINASLMHIKDCEIEVLTAVLNVLHKRHPVGTH